MSADGGAADWSGNRGQLLYHRHREAARRNREEEKQERKG